MSVEQPVEAPAGHAPVLEPVEGGDGATSAACECGHQFGVHPDQRSARAMWARHAETVG